MCGQANWPDNHIFIASEATIPGVRQYRTSMKDVREAVTAMFQSIITPMRQSVLAAAMRDEDGTLDRNQRNRVLREVGQLVEGLFVAEGRFAFADDGVTARTPFADLLNRFYVRVTMEAVYVARDWMANNIPADVFQFLSQARPLNLGEAENPFLRRDGEDDEAFLQRMDDLRVFRPNPLAELDPKRQWVPMHRWNDSNGYQLSDRIWRAGNRTRAKVDGLISEAFREGWGAERLAATLEQFLLPNRANLRTNKPYGTNGSFDAMRLARTEIARAANHASFISAYTNPYVNQIDVARSPNGDKECKICPQHATIGIGGGRLREPYSIYAASLPVYHPHCVTPGQLVTTHRGKIPIEDVQIGDYVLTHKGRFRRVLNAWSKYYDGLVHNIRSEFGRVELTSEHPVLSSTGWRDAQLIQTGEQILHASIDIFPDLVTSITECKPAESFHFGIPDSVLFGIVPKDTVAFDSDFTRNKGEVKLVFPDRIFSNIFDFNSIKGLHHGTFNRIRNTLTLHAKQFGAPDNQSGVMSFSSLRDFLTNFGALSGVIIPRQIQMFIDFTEYFARKHRTSPVIFLPTQLCDLATVSKFKSKMVNNIPKSTIGNTELLSNFVRSPLLYKIESLYNLFNGLSFFNFNVFDVLKSSVPYVAFAAKFATSFSTTNSTFVEFRHDNLLSLSPDIFEGIRSGNRSVEWIANPLQAQLNYNTVEYVSARPYQGLVYNMSVEEDESYVVDDIVVHNCMCHVRPVLADSPSTVTNRLRAVMEDERARLFPPSVNPAAADALVQTLLHRALNGLVAQFRGQFLLPGF